MNQKVFKFEILHNSDLIIDAIYEGNNKGNAGDDPISKILNVGNQGGFRFRGSKENIKYLVLYTSGYDPDWPDLIDLETGIFQYYGDNKTPGHELHNTSKNGNEVLRNLFTILHDNHENLFGIPPIFIFEKCPTKNSKRSVKYRGLCVPGAIHLDSTDDLVAIWKSFNGSRFQNYKAYFTILDIPVIKREWLNTLDSDDSLSIAPNEFKSFIYNKNYTPLVTQKTLSIRTVEEQIPTEKIEKEMLSIIYNYFITSPTEFESFAAMIYQMSDQNVIIDEITRGVRDGGKDAVGRYKIGMDSDKIFIDFGLEAKCYNPGLDDKKINTVGVKETSRLISRIRNRQFGVMVTTSAVSKQAYEELREDKHPIIIISGMDIVRILKSKGYSTNDDVKKKLETEFLF